jgi:two-component system sensor histidine kinase CreC
VRQPAAEIYGIRKERMDLRVYVTDAAGKVRFDSENRALGEDFSRWQDVARTLRGEYGARTTREDPDNPFTSSMYVAAPILWQGQIIGVLTIVKPTAGLAPYLGRMNSRIREGSLIVLAASALIGLAFSAWLIVSIKRLIRYARNVSAGRHATPPTGGGSELSELAHALALMRERLEGKQYVEKYVQNLAHEMKSPLTAVISAAELLDAPLPETERHRFTTLLRDEAARLHQIIERMLQLARVEQLRDLENQRTLDLAELTRQTMAARLSSLEKKRLTVSLAADGAFSCRGDAFLLQQAIGNLLDNAIDFSPDDSEIIVTLAKTDNRLTLTVRDHGAGAPDYALPRLFERFYSLPRPDSQRKSTGLGLSFVREVARLHGGEAVFRNHPQGGAEVSMNMVCT